MNAPKSGFRILLGIACTGLALGAAMGVSTRPLEAVEATSETSIATEAVRPGYGHIDVLSDGLKFCHCGYSEECYPCANQPPSRTGTSTGTTP